MYGNQVTHMTFPLSFQSVDSGHPPRLQSTSTLVAVWRDHPKQVQKRMNDRSTRRSNQVLKLTDYHISRHVASIFKRLITTTTHYALSTFLLNQRGLNHKYHPMTPPVILMIAVCSRHSIPIISRVTGNHSTFTGPN